MGLRSGREYGPVWTFWSARRIPLSATTDYIFNPVAPMSAVHGGRLLESDIDWKKTFQDFDMCSKPRQFKAQINMSHCAEGIPGMGSSKISSR